MKRIRVAAMSLTLACAMLLPAAAAANPAAQTPEKSILHAEAQEETPGCYTLEINGRDTEMNAVLMVPLRMVAESLGFTVSWDDGTVLLDNGTMHTTVTIGLDRYIVSTSVEGIVGMSAPFSLGAAPYIVNNTAYVPLELFDALLGSKAGTITLDGGRIKIHTEEAGNVQIANPYLVCGSLQEAAEAAGFSLAAPENIPGYDRVSILAVSRELIEVRYQSGEDTVSIRKAAGTGDISGDYNSYAESRSLSVNGMTVAVKGDHSRAYLATWTNDGYTYAISASAGLDVESLSGLIREVA